MSYERTPAHRHKASETAKARFAQLTPAQRQARMAPARQKTLEPDTIAKANASRAVRYAVVGGPNKGRKFSDVTRAKQSEAMKRRLAEMSSNERKTQYGHGTGGAVINRETDRRLRAKTPETRRRMSAARVAYMEAAGHQYWASSLELAARDVLSGMGVHFHPQKRIGNFVVDIEIPERRLVIECDGEYWHSRPGDAEADAKRDAALSVAGYSVLRLHEAEIKSGGFRSILAEVA